MHGLWEHAAMPNLVMAGFFLPLWLGEMLSLWPLALGGGTGNLIRRSEYDAVGGHEAMREAVIDDVGFAQHVRRRGHRTNIVLADRLVSLRMYHGFDEIVHGFTKNVFALVGHSFIGSAFMLLSFLLFHAVPVVLAVMGNRIAIVTVGLILLTRVVLFTALRYPLWSAILLHPFQVVIWVWIMLRSTWVVGIRGELNWRGRKYDPARTRFGADPGRRSS
jgi:chlorobactene glucosyltransferase